LFSDEIVSCYKDTAQLVLFHDVEGEVLRGSRVVRREDEGAVRLLMEQYSREERKPD
jgi:hypothetical protein